VAVDEHGDTSISTSVDRLLDVLKQTPEITFQKAAATLGVTEAIIESWVQFLEETGDVEVTYKFTTPYISLSKKREEKMQVKEDKDFSKKSIEDVMNVIDAQFEQASKIIKQKKIQESLSFLEGMSSKIKLIFDTLKDKNIPPQELEVFKKELTIIDEQLSKANEENKKRRQRNAQKIIEQSFIRLKDNHIKTKAIATKYKAPQKVEVVQEKKPEEQVVMQKAVFSHDELTAKIKEALQKGDLDEANRLYTEMDKLYKEELPKRFEMERENLKKSLFHISKDLTFARDSEQNSRYMKARTQIFEGFSNLAKIITDGKVADAIYSLRYIQSLFSNLPQGYEEEKREMQTRLAEATNQIAGLRTDTISRITRNYEVAAEEMHHEFNSAIEQKDLQRAQQYYNNLKMAFQRFPSELVPEKTQAHIVLLEDFQKLSSLFKDLFEEQNTRRIERTREQIATLDKQIRLKQVEDGQKTYNRIQIMIQEISDYYFEDKAKLQNDMIEAYKNFSDISSTYYQEEFTRLAGEINYLITEGERYINQQNYELAEESYVKALDHYTQLKPGMMDKKKLLRDSLFEFYRKIMFMRDNSIIEKNSKIVYEAYSQIISLIIDAHHKIALNDIHSLPIISSQISQNVSKIPGEVWQKNPSVKKEIEKINQETALYTSVKQFEDKKSNGILDQELSNKIKILVVNVSRDSPEDSNLIDYAKSALQIQGDKIDRILERKIEEPKPIITKSVNQNQKTGVKVDNQIPEDKNSQTSVSSEINTKKDIIEDNDISEQEKKEDLEEEMKSKEFEKTVSAALLLSDLDETTSQDLPDLRDAIETHNKNRAPLTQDTQVHKKRVSSNIERLKGLLSHK
jgi:hypothetical protein